MDYTPMQVHPAFAQPRPLRPYQYPSHYGEYEDPFGSRPFSVPASHILRSNSFPEPYPDVPTGPPTIHQSTAEPAAFSSFSAMEDTSSNSFMIANPSMMPPSFMPSRPVAFYPHQQAMPSFAHKPSHMSEGQQPVFHRQPLRKRYKGGAGPFPCPKCGRYFRRRSDMQRHQRKRNPCGPDESKSEPARSPAPLPQLRERPNAAAYHNAGYRRHGDFLIPPRSKLDDDFRRPSV